MPKRRNIEAILFAHRKRLQLNQRFGSEIENDDPSGLQTTGRRSEIGEGPAAHQRKNINSEILVQPHSALFQRKVFWRQFAGESLPELRERGEESLDIWPRRLHEKIKVLCGPDKTIQADRHASSDEVVNGGPAELYQQTFERFGHQVEAE